MQYKLNRRRFLAAGISLGAGFAVAKQLLPLASQNTPPSLYGCCQLNDSSYALAALKNGQPNFSLPLPTRGHDVVMHPYKTQLIAIGRRPGTWMKVIDTVQQSTLVNIAVPTGFTVNGHACFSADGRYLFSTETQTITQKGFIGIYDSEDNYRFLQRFEAGGIDPHEVVLMPDNKTLVVANGGIIASENSDAPINLDTMQSSLTYIESESGKVLAQYMPQQAQMSLRHLAVANNGTVFIGVQYQGAKQNNVPLLLKHNGEDHLQAFNGDNHWQALNQYVASVACDKQAQEVVITSPKGNSIMRWNAQSQSLIAQESLRDVAGAFWSEQQQAFVVSNSIGQLVALHKNQPQSVDSSLPFLPQWHWDNHMLEA
jgi:hypothetical protein